MNPSSQLSFVHLFSFKLSMLTDSLFLIKSGLVFLPSHAGGVIGQLQIELFALKHVRKFRVCSESELKIWSRCLFYRGEREEKKTTSKKPLVTFLLSVK